MVESMRGTPLFLASVIADLQKHVYELVWVIKWTWELKLS